jgi:hypothetical protein
MNADQQVDIAQLARRIDHLTRELLEIRRQISSLQAGAHRDDPRPHLADELFGALGHGDWQEYDFFAEYERFSE